MITDIGSWEAWVRGGSGGGGLFNEEGCAIVCIAKLALTKPRVITNLEYIIESNLIILNQDNNNYKVSVYLLVCGYFRY